MMLLQTARLCLASQKTASKTLGLFRNTLTHVRLPCQPTLAAASYVTENNTKLQEITRKNANSFLDKYDTVLLDCDGVLWRTDYITPIPGIAETIQKIQRLGKRILYVTNNSMHCRSNFVTKFRDYGFDSLKTDVFCVAYAAAVYLKRKEVKSKVYVLGTQGMSQELDEVGIENFGVGPDPDPVALSVKELLEMKLPDACNVGAVLVGHDKYFDLNKLYKASSFLSREECLFIATNYLEKSRFIAPDRVQPVTGAIVDAVISSSERKPEVLGKPYSHLFECITAVHPDIDLDRTVMIGDSLKADIAFAKTVGMDSALVLSGASNLSSLNNFPGLEPNYVLQDLTVLNTD